MPLVQPFGSWGYNGYTIFREAQIFFFGLDGDISPQRPAGRWNGAEGASRCTDCPLGRASDVLGATVEAVCEAGKARFFRSI